MQTDRLEVRAATIEYIRSELEAPERLAALLEAHVEPGWPPGEYDRDAQEFFLDRLTEGGMSVAGWYVWYAIRRRNACQPSVLIGAGGYFGPPNEEGIVEIGFSVMPSWQGLGYATDWLRYLWKTPFPIFAYKRLSPIPHLKTMHLEGCLKNADSAVSAGTGSQEAIVLKS